MIVYSRSEADTEAAGAALSKRLRAGDFVALFGPMGAGKTAFVRGLAAALGCSEGRSPTFTIVHEYPTQPPLFHFDLYRLGGADELWDIGFDEYMHRGGVVLMEWPEVAPEVLPTRRYDVRIAPTGADERTIEITEKTEGQ